MRGVLEGLKQVTILVGKNGAGKLAILEALYLVSACAESANPIRKINKLDYVIQCRGSRGT